MIRVLTIKEWYELRFQKEKLKVVEEKAAAFQRLVDKINVAYEKIAASGQVADRILISQETYKKLQNGKNS